MPNLKILVDIDYAIAEIPKPALSPYEAETLIKAAIAHGLSEHLVPTINVTAHLEEIAS